MAYDRGDYRQKWRIERIAAAVRRHLGLSPLSILTVEAACDAVRAHVLVPEDFGDVALAQQLRRAAWDAFSFTYPGENVLIIVVNPARAPSRRAATLMEEVSHHILGHVPSAIWVDGTGLPRRDYNEAQEREAFDLGAALLLPKEKIQSDVGRQRRAMEIAVEHGCSMQLVEYRIKRLRLWNRYRSYAA